MRPSKSASAAKSSSNLNLPASSLKKGNVQAPLPSGWNSPPGASMTPSSVTNSLTTTFRAMHLRYSTENEQHPENQDSEPDEALEPRLLAALPVAADHFEQREEDRRQ